MANKSGRSTQFGVCIDNAGYPASLEVGKLYPVIPDPQSAQHGYLRVIDESGEDYGYSAKRFFMLDVPDALGKALAPRRSTAIKRPRRALQPIARKARR
jgi:hypothetical protein